MMLFVFLGFVLLAVLCAYQGKAQFAEAAVLETDPNVCHRATKVRTTAYFLCGYAGACALGSVVTLFMWVAG
jgi:hypothetical protein